MIHNGVCIGQDGKTPNTSLSHSLRSMELIYFIEIVLYSGFSVDVWFNNFNSCMENESLCILPTFPWTKLMIYLWCMLIRIQEYIVWWSKTCNWPLQRVQFPEASSFCYSFPPCYWGFFSKCYTYCCKTEDTVLFNLFTLSAHSTLSTNRFLHFLKEKHFQSCVQYLLIIRTIFLCSNTRGHIVYL